MSQRDSTYERKERDSYPTPPWVTKALVPHLRQPLQDVWEPACGSGAMVDALHEAGGFCVTASDIHETRQDFLQMGIPKSWGESIGAIITNPPYTLAQEFCEHALRLMEPVGGQVAMLLRVDFDSAKTRSHLFRDCPAWSKKVVLTKRIVWFVEDDGKPKSSPSENHALYIWDWKHEGPPTLAYAP